MLSVILPVGKDFTNLERTIRSVRLQTNTDWELLAVDFGSEDGRNESLQAWPRRDPRIRVGMVVRNRCPAAARNAALQRARGEFITYLDPGDEYYPNYLAEVVAAAQESDVLFFGFDIAYENGSADGGPTAWDPGQVIDRLFAANIVPPLGVAHRRSALERVGGFNELLCRGEDWDLWKRLARAGLRFRCLASKSGRHSAAADRANRERTPTPFQLQTLAANWQAGRPLYCAVKRWCDSLGSQGRVDRLRLAALPVGFYERGGDCDARRIAPARRTGIRVRGVLRHALRRIAGVPGGRVLDATRPERRRPQGRERSLPRPVARCDRRQSARDAL